LARPDEHVTLRKCLRFCHPAVTEEQISELEARQLNSVRITLRQDQRVLATSASGIATSFEVQPADFPRLTPDLETAIFRVLQEALTNVFRHSGASKTFVTLRQQEDQVMVTVGDDGKGVGPAIAEMRVGILGVGLAGMRQRAKEFGEELRLTNTNPGTLVEIVIPARCLIRQEAHATTCAQSD
jgi:signal transduction histidine kinase